MNPISAQVSLYPLRQAHLSPSISGMLDALRSRLFDGLKAAFQSAAATGDVVMVVSFSNCCSMAVE